MPTSPPPTPRCSAYQAASASGSPARNEMAPMPVTPMVAVLPLDAADARGFEHDPETEQEDDERTADLGDPAYITSDVGVLVARPLGDRSAPHADLALHGSTRAIARRARLGVGGLLGRHDLRFQFGRARLLGGGQRHGPRRRCRGRLRGRSRGRGAALEPCPLARAARTTAYALGHGRR